MAAVFRRRPAAVPAIAAESIVTVGNDVADPAVRRALQSVQRTIATLATPVGKSTSHPTLRDSVMSVTLSDGTNWIDNPIGRKPRFIYVTPLASGITSWFWAQQSADLDMTRIDLEVTSSNPVACLVRFE